MGVCCVLVAVKDAMDVRCLMCCVMGVRCLMCCVMSVWCLMCCQYNTINNTTLLPWVSTIAL